MRRISAEWTIATVAAGLHTPYGVAIGPQREIYIADLGNNRVRFVNPDGVIATFAGGGDKLPAAGTPIKATEAKLDQPRNVAVDYSGVVYISDFAPTGSTVSRPTACLSFGWKPAYATPQAWPLTAQGHLRRGLRQPPRTKNHERQGRPAHFRFRSGYLDRP